MQWAPNCDVGEWKFSEAKLEEEHRWATTGDGALMLRSIGLRCVGDSISTRIHYILLTVYIINFDLRKIRISQDFPGLNCCIMSASVCAYIVLWRQGLKARSVEVYILARCGYMYIYNREQIFNCEYVGHSFILHSSFILLSVFRQVQILFQNELSTEWDLMIILLVNGILCFP